MSKRHAPDLEVQRTCRNLLVDLLNRKEVRLALGARRPRYEMRCARGIF
jgi:hypothetical protein